MFSVPNPIPDFSSIQAVVASLINIAFMAAGLVATIYLIVGGFRYITSSGNQEAIEGAKATIVNAIIGLIIIFLSFLIVNYILGELGVAQVGVEKAKSAPQFAQDEGIVPKGDDKTIPDPLPGKNLQDIINSVFNVAYGLAGIVAIIYLIYGGYMYITSSGNPDASEAAKSTIVNSIIGLIIILTSYLIIHFALEQLEVKKDYLVNLLLISPKS